MDEEGGCYVTADGNIIPIDPAERAAEMERMGSDDVDDIENDENEMDEIAVKTLRDPGSPTREERKRHYATHMPFRSWCPVCTQGKGKENPHWRKKVKVESDKAEVGLDYKSFGQK